jgi:hypothetical protein
MFEVPDCKGCRVWVPCSARYVTDGLEHNLGLVDCNTKKEAG